MKQAGQEALCEASSDVEQKCCSRCATPAQTTTVPLPRRAELSTADHDLTGTPAQIGTTARSPVVEPAALDARGRHHERAKRINAVARSLTPAEAKAVDAYHRDVRTARMGFRAELAAVGLGGELARADYDDV